jgi:hypothetical protein
MPFSDMEGYEHGHFRRVYDHLIRPACHEVGLEVMRGDDVKGTNYIAIDILQRVIKSDLVVCDLSGRNANVLYELGLRQAFDLPVVLIKDERTERIFDIQGLRTLDYRSTLRVDSVAEDRQSIRQAIEATLRLEKHDINSLVRLLGVEKAVIAQQTQVSPETALVLSAVKDLSARLSNVEAATSGRFARASSRGRLSEILAKQMPKRFQLPGGTEADHGDTVFGSVNGEHVELGQLMTINEDGVLVKSETGDLVIYPPDDPTYPTITDIPF